MTATPRVYVTDWPQEHVLDYFWCVAHELDCRLDALIQLATVKVRRPEDWDRELVRAVRLPLPPRECFACATRERLLYWHHIIAVQHGGDSHRRNLVAICRRCHALIHPWLDQNTGHEQRGGFVQLRDIITGGRWINDAGEIVDAERVIKS